MIPADQSYRTGIILVFVSALVFSTAGIFAKGVSAGAFEIIFWRGIFAAGFTIAYASWRGHFTREFVRMGWSGFFAALIGACATAAFISSFKLTAIANVALIWASAPLFAALITWIWIGEHLSRNNILACIAAFAGVAVIVTGSLGGVHLTGDLLALTMTVGIAIMMGIYRRWPDTPAAGPAALSSILLLPVCWPMGDMLAVPVSDFTILAAFGLVFAVASVTLGEGVKRVPAGETALIGTLETPIAPVLAWMFFREVPAMTTFIGGAVVLAAVLWSQRDNFGTPSRWKAHQNPS